MKTHLRRWLPIGMLVLGLTLVVYALFFGSSDEDAIREQMQRIADVVEVNEGANIAVRAARIRKVFVATIDKNVELEMPEVSNKPNGRREMAALAIGLSRHLRHGHLSMDDLKVELDPSKARAMAYGKAALEGAKFDGEVVHEERTSSLVFEKNNDGDWILTSVLLEAKRQ